MTVEILQIRPKYYLVIWLGQSTEYYKTGRRYYIPREDIDEAL